MSSQDLVRKLKELGCEDAKFLHPDSLDWMFEDDEVITFLTWFCSNVDENNILTPEEVQQFEELQAEGKVLDNTQLESLDSLKVSDEYSDTYADVLSMKHAVESMREEIERLQKEQDEIATTENAMSLHETALQERLFNLEKLQKDAKMHQQQVLEESSNVSDELDTSLNQVKMCVDSVVTCANSVLSQKINSGIAAADLHDYFKEEELYVMKVKECIEKQFSKELQESDLARDSEMSYRGRSNMEYDSLCEEIKRIEYAVEKSYREYYEALITAAADKASLKTATEVLTDFHLNQFPESLPSLKSHLQVAQLQQAKLKADVENATKELSKLIQRAARATPLLAVRSDQEHKLLRQEYYLHCRQKVINILLQQTARLSIISSLMLIDKKQMHDNQVLLTALKSLLCLHSDNFAKRRTMMYNAMKTQESSLTQTTFDTEDKFILRLYHKLGGRMDDMQFVITCDLLTETVKKFKDRYSKESQALHNSNVNVMNKLKEMQQGVKEWEKLVCQGSQLILSPSQLSNAISQLSSLEGNLRESILDTSNYIDKCNKALRVDETLHKERNLFLKFFNSPRVIKQECSTTDTSS